jgi:alkylglycerol monooxygenase
MFYLPIALFIPPQLFYMHKQVNTLYQFWIHTRLIGKLGPLEWFLNTPSHHRVHHGRNRKYIDKNYAGILIIWDRIFGTFEAEEEEVVYGLVHPLNSFDPLWTQLHHFFHMFTYARSLPGVWNKICVFIKGPGWSPGKPRLGDINDIPDVEPDASRKVSSKRVI